MDDKELRRQLEKNVGREIPSSVWDYLKEWRYIDGYREGKEGWDDLVFEAKVQLKIEDEKERQEGAGADGAHKRRPKKPTLTKEIHPNLGLYEKSRARAFGEYIALGATLFLGFQDFREEFLGGEVLTPEGAHRFVHSPANRVCSPGWFEKEGIDPSAHKWRWLRPLAVPDSTDEGYTWPRIYPLLIYPPNKEYVLPEVNMFEDRGAPLSFPAVTEDEDYRYSAGRIELIDFKVESVLGRLKLLSNGLEDYSNYAWEEAQAAWFVLTGEATPASALMVQIQGGYSYGDLSNAKVTLEVEPWVPAETVSRVYRDIQQGLLQKTNNRKISERSLTLLRFVVRELRDSIPKGGLSNDDEELLRVVMYKAMGDPLNEETRAGRKYKKPTWEELRKQWNQTQKEEWRYVNYPNFRRAFYNVATLVAGSDYVHRLEGLEELRIDGVPLLNQKE